MADELTKSDLRKFGTMMGGVIAVLFGLLLPWFFDYSWPLWPWLLAGGFWLPAVVAPRLLRKVYSLWMAFGQGAGWVNTRIILGLVFFLVFTPVGLAMRLFGRDPMRREIRPALDSYRIVCDHPPEPTDLERPF